MQGLKRAQIARPQAGGRAHRTVLECRSIQRVGAAELGPRGKFRYNIFLQLNLLRTAGDRLIVYYSTSIYKFSSFKKSIFFFYTAVALNY